MIYLDYHATTPVDPRVLEAMLPYFTERFGNASSRSHPFGWAAKDAVEKARADVGALIGASSRDIVFTSGATESNNLAIKGVVEACREKGNHVITCATEHHSVLDTCRRLEERGASVTYLPVQADGRISLDELNRAITPATILISIMAANNEIGVLQPVEAIGALAKERGILFHTDAAQAAGKVPVDVKVAHADLVSLTAHKLYGPKGVGALYVRRRAPQVALAEQIHGGGHERGLRSGTLNVPGIVGFGAAAALCMEELPAEGARLAALRDRLLAGLRHEVPDVRVNGSLQHRLPNNLNVSFSGVEGESLLMGLNEVAVSSGAACTSASKEPSHVLKAIGCDGDLGIASIRFGLGRWTTAEEVEFAAGYVARLVLQLRQMSPLSEASAAR